MADFNHYDTNEQSFTLLDVEKEFKENKNYVTFPDQLTYKMKRDSLIESFNYYPKNKFNTPTNEIVSPQNSTINFEKVFEDLENGTFFGNISEEDRKKLGIYDALETLKKEVKNYLLKYKLILFCFNQITNFIYGRNESFQLDILYEVEFEDMIFESDIDICYKDCNLSQVDISNLPFEVIQENQTKETKYSFVFPTESSEFKKYPGKDSFKIMLELVLESENYKYHNEVKHAFENPEVLTYFIVEVMNMISTNFHNSDNKFYKEASKYYSMNCILAFLIKNPCITMEDFLYIFFDKETIKNRMDGIRLEIDIYRLYMRIFEPELENVEGYHLKERIYGNRFFHNLQRYTLLMRDLILKDFVDNSCLEEFIAAVSSSNLEVNVRKSLKTTLDNVLTIDEAVTRDKSVNSYQNEGDYLRNEPREEYDYENVFKFIDACKAKKNIVIYEKFKDWRREYAQVDDNKIEEIMFSPNEFDPEITEQSYNKIMSKVQQLVEKHVNDRNTLFSDKSITIISKFIFLVLIESDEDEVEREFMKQNADLAKHLFDICPKYCHVNPHTMIKLCSLNNQWPLNVSEVTEVIRDCIEKMVSQSKNYPTLKVLEKFKDLYKFKKPKIEFVELPVLAREEILSDDSEDNFDVENFENTAKHNEIIEISDDEEEEQDDEDELSHESIYSQKESSYRIPNNPTLLDDFEIFEEGKEKENITDYDDHASELENNEENMSESENNEEHMSELDIGNSTIDALFNEDPYEYWYDTLQIRMLEVLDSNNEAVEDIGMVDFCSKFDMIYMMTRLFEDNRYKLKRHTMFREYCLFSISRNYREPITNRTDADGEDIIVGYDYTKLRNWWNQNNRINPNEFERTRCPPASKYYPKVYDLYCDADMKRESRLNYYDEMKTAFFKREVKEALIVIMIKNYRWNTFTVTQHMLLKYNNTCRLLTNGFNLLIGLQRTDENFNNEYGKYNLKQDIIRSIETNDLMKIIYLLKIENVENGNYDFYYKFKPNYHIYQNYPQNLIDRTKTNIKFGVVGMTIPVFDRVNLNNENPHVFEKRPINEVDIRMCAFEMYSLRDIKFWEYFTPNMRVVYSFIFVFMKNMSLDFLHKEQINNPNGNLQYDEMLGEYRPRNLLNGEIYSILTEDWSLEQVQGQGVMDNREDEQGNKLFFEEVNFNVPFYRRDSKIDDATKTYRREYLRPVDETKLHFNNNLSSNDNDNEETKEIKKQQREKIKTWLEKVPLPAMENMYGVFAKRRVATNAYSGFEDRELESLITVFSRDDTSIEDFDNFIINLLFDFRYRTDAYFQTETINGMMDVCLDCYIEIIVQREVDDGNGNVKQFHIERRQLLQFAIDMIFPSWDAYDEMYQKHQPLRVAGRLPPVISWEKVFIILKIKDQLHPSAHRNFTGYLLPFYIEPKNELGEQRFHDDFLNEIEKYGIFTRDKLEKDTKGCFIRSLEKCLEMKNELNVDNQKIIDTIKSRLITGGVSKKNFERICQEFNIRLTFVYNRVKYTNKEMHTESETFGKNIQGHPRFSCNIALFQDTEYGISHYFPYVERTGITKFYLTHYEECEKLYPRHQFRGQVQPIYRMSQITEEAHMKFDKNAVGLSSLQLIEKMVLFQMVKRVFNFDFYKVSPQIAEKLPTTLPLMSPEDYREMKREKPEWQKNQKRTRRKKNNQNIERINELNITEQVNHIENENEDDDIENEFIINEGEFTSKENPKQMDSKFIFFADTETIINEEIHKTYLACAISYDGKKTFTASGDNAAKTLLIQIAQYCDSIEEKEKEDGKENKTNPPIIIYFHNLGYDSRVIEDVIITSSIEKNAKIYCEKIILRYSRAIDVENRDLPRKNTSQRSKTFLLKDTLGVIPFALKSFSSVFKLEGDNEKEYMPYKLYTKENIARETLLKEEFFRDLKCENKEEEIVKRMKKSDSECLDGDRIKIVEYAKYYCMQDVNILRNGFIKYQKMMLDTLNIDIARHCTISGIAYTYFRDKCFYQVGCMDLPIYEYTGAVRDYIRNCIVGGRCMVSAYYINGGCVIGRPWTDEKRIVDYDACSLYPSAVGRLLLPTGHPHNILNSKWLKQDINGKNIPDTGKIVDQFVPEQEQPSAGKIITAFIGKIRITNYDKETTYPFPLFRVKNEKGSNEYTNNPKLPLEMYVDNITLEDLIKYHKIEFEILEGMYWTGYKCDRFSKEMKKVYNERRDLKSKGDPNEIVYKLIMNSCYGKTIQKPIIEEIVFKHPESNIGGEDQYIENYEIKNYGIIKEKISIDEKNIKYKVFREIDEIFSPSLIGVLILSMSKRIMNEVMCLMKNGIIEVEENGMTTIVQAEAFYQDTDSIHMTYETMVALEKAFKQNYGRDLRGSQMGQFHPDFPQINGKDTRSVASIFLGKKAYCDILRIDDPSTEEDRHKYKAFVRLKGIPEENVIQTANEMNMNIYDFYYYMAHGNAVDYDLLATRVRFKMRKDYKVSTVEEFKRKVQFPVAYGLDCYENDEKGIHVPLKLNLNEKPEGMN